MVNIRVEKKVNTTATGLETRKKKIGIGMKVLHYKRIESSKFAVEIVTFFALRSSRNAESVDKLDINSIFNECEYRSNTKIYQEEKVGL